MRINKSGLKCGLFTSREVRLNGKISLESCKDAIRTKEKTLISFENQGLFVVERPQLTMNTNYGWPGRRPGPPQSRPAGCHR